MDTFIEACAAGDSEEEVSEMEENIFVEEEEPVPKKVDLQAKVLKYHAVAD